MKIKAVELKNAFQHKSLKVKLAPFQAITGSNGSGKSNLIEAIGYNLTNKMALPGTRDTMLTNGEEKGHIKLTISHEGEEIVNKCSLNGSSRTFKKGDVSIRRGADIMEALSDMMHISPTIFEEVALIRQGDLSRGLFDTPSKRMQFFLKLAGLGDIEKKRDKLLEEKSEYNTPMVSFNVENKRCKVKEAQEEVLQLEAKVKKLAVSSAGRLSRIDSLQTDIGIITRRNEAASNVPALKEESIRLTALLEDAKTKHQERRSELAKLEMDLELRKDAYDQARARMSSYEQVKVQMQMLIARRGTAAGSLKGVQDSDPGEYTGSDPSKIADVLAKIQANKTHVNGIIKVLSITDGSDVVCPVCEQDISGVGVRALLDKFSAEIAGLIAVEAQAQTKLDTSKVSSKTHAANLRKFRDGIAAYTAELAAVTASIENLESCHDGEYNVADDERFVEDYSIRTDDVKDVQSKFDKIVAIMNSTEVKLVKTNSELEKYADVPATIDTSKSLVDLAGELTVLKDTEEDYTRSDARLGEAKKRAAEGEVELGGLIKQQEEMDKMNKYTDVLEFARSILHRGIFPAGKIKAFIMKSLGRINEYLAVMRSGFNISYDSDAGFIASFPYGKEMRADRLSGGERIAFALAFRFAINEQFGAGFIILDEPTQWLDEEHIDHFIKTLDLVRSNLVPATQVVIVTHVYRVAAVCDSIIDISAKA